MQGKHFRQGSQMKWFWRQEKSTLEIEQLARMTSGVTYVWLQEPEPCQVFSILWLAQTEVARTDTVETERASRHKAERSGLEADRSNQS